MGKKRRRGSSTRKYRSCPKPNEEIKVMVTGKKCKTNQDRETILKIEAAIRSGKNLQGLPLTEKEISMALANISMLEHKLGIKSSINDSGIYTARH